MNPAPPHPPIEAARALITGRSNLSARRLVPPGPDAAELRALLELAAAAPDHGQIRPWRFVRVPPGQRVRLGNAFASALAERDPDASDEQRQAAHEKALRAPELLVAIARLGPAEPDIPAAERLVSLGAAIQNLLLGAHALGYASSLTSGKAMGSAALAALLGLAPGEQAVCCINLGREGSPGRGRRRERPGPDELMTTLGQG